MRNVSLQEYMELRITQVQVETPLTSLLNIKHDDKYNKYFVKLKLRRNLTSVTWDLYEINMALFDNENLEDSVDFEVKEDGKPIFLQSYPVPTVHEDLF